MLVGRPTIFNPEEDPKGLDTVVRRRHVKAAELYWASQAPARFTAGLQSGERLCGVVVIWTKFARN